MEQFKEDILEIKEDVKSLAISNRLQEITLVKIEQDLKYHIKRTDALEQLVAIQKDEFKSTHEFVLKAQAITAGTLKVLSALGIIAGLILKAMGVF